MIDAKDTLTTELPRISHEQATNPPYLRPLSGHDLPVDPSIVDAKDAEPLVDMPRNHSANSAKPLLPMKIQSSQAPVSFSKFSKNYQNPNMQEPRADLCVILEAWALMTERSRHAMITVAKALVVKP